jgi:hypothetical protein
VCDEADKALREAALGVEKDPLEEIVKRVKAVAAAGGLQEVTVLAKSSYSNPAEFAEEVICCRAITHDAAAAVEIAMMRMFVEEAEVPRSQQELYTDRVAQREDLSYSVAVDYPHSFAGVRSRFQLFKQRYQRAYIAHHRSYWAETAGLRSKLVALDSRIRALSKLNGLSELGTPLGQDIAERANALLTQTAACPNYDSLDAALQGTPVCPACGITLASEPPYAQAEELRTDLDQALASQLQRLSSQTVQHILSRRTGDSVERFLKVVQASDLAGLADVLSDELVAFLRQMLSEANARVRLQPLLDRIAQAYPADVGEKDVDGIVQDLKRLLEESLRASVRDSSILDSRGPTSSQ